MIIIVVIDKLLAFTGPFPIKLSEKLFSSCSLLMQRAGSCSWHWIVMIPEKSWGFFLSNLFLLKCIFIVDSAFNE